MKEQMMKQKESINVCVPAAAPIESIAVPVTVFPIGPMPMPSSVGKSPSLSEG
jgi:hypothetical protein